MPSLHRMFAALIVSYLSAGGGLLCADVADLIAPEKLPARLRRPIALAYVAENDLWVAHQRSGTLMRVDPAAGKVLGEWPIARELQDLAALPNGGLAAVDPVAHELVLVDPPTLGTPPENARLKLRRIPVARHPVGVAVLPNGKVAVASLWSQRLTLVNADTGTVTATVDLPFAARRLLPLKEPPRLIAADAFAGRLAVLDPESGELLRQREFPGHNIRGLALSGDGTMLLVAHQMLNDLANTTRNDVHWGLVISNDLRWLRLEAVLTEDADLYRGAYMQPLGEAGRGGGDPSGLAVTRDGLVVAPLGAADQVVLARDDRNGIVRLGLQSRPTAVALSPNQSTAVVAETFNDSLALLDLKRLEVRGRIELGPTRLPDAAARGEMLFYSGRLAHDRWMSCHSCHTDGHTNGGLSDNLSDGTFGAPKRVLSLLGVADTLPLAWNGETPDLPTQVRNSIEKTMQAGEPPTPEEVADLTAFLETLQAPPSLAEARGERDFEQIARGQAHFKSLGCAGCHRPPTYTTPRTYDVGLVDQLGNRKFNPPSLRGISQRAPLLHDGSAADLHDLLHRVGHQLRAPLSTETMAELRAFLDSL